MEDWIGLGFIVLLVVGAAVGWKLLSRPSTRTSEEFERNAAASTSGLGASVNALQELMNPQAAKAKEVEMQMKDGRYKKKEAAGRQGTQPDNIEAQDL